MTAEADVGRIALDERLDTMAAAPLRAALLARRGVGLGLDAGAVRHLGTLCLQVLLAAARDWRAAGLPFNVEPRSAAFCEALALFALPPDAIEGGK